MTLNFKYINAIIRPAWKGLHWQNILVHLEMNDKDKWKFQNIDTLGFWYETLVYHSL